MNKSRNPIEPSFVFYGPHHTSLFKNPVRNILRGIRLPNKYEGIFDFMIGSGLDIYLSGRLVHSHGIRGVIESVIDSLELILWCLLNGISLRQVGLIFNKKGLQGKDIFFAIYYGNFTHENNELASKGAVLAEYLSDINCYKVVHLTHYVYNSVIGAENLRKFNPDLLLAENNLLINSKFYEKHFSSLPKNFYQLPFVPAKRFVTETPHEERINKIFATGTITYQMCDKEFIDFYGGNELQPLRRALYENANLYLDEMECRISDLNATRLTGARSTLAKRIYNRLFYKHPQFKYYGENIVSLYNNYKMFVVPEEICNLPGISFIEGMACGCVYFGIDDPMYTSIGMQPGIHYVTYDGTEEDLMVRVRHYQMRPEELKIISENGCQFATKTMSSQVVYGDFKSYLLKQTEGMI